MTHESDERADIISAAKELGSKVDNLSGQLTISKNQIDRNDRNTKWLYVVIAAMLAILVVLSYTIFTVSRTGSNVNTNQECVARWADAYTKRANLITDLGKERTSALDALVRTFTLDGKTQSAQFSAALANYLEASDKYNRGLNENPIPPSPVFDCV